MGVGVSSPERRARRLLRWYPNSWRTSHAEEFAALLEDSMAERPLWLHRGFDIAIQGLRLRGHGWMAATRTSRRRALLGTSASLVVLVGALAIMTSGFGTLGLSGPTKGGMPLEPGKSVAYASIPDYVSVFVGPNKIGYTPKAYVAAPNGFHGDSPMGLPAPVYASDLKTLLGHEYPGIGFVPLGKSPWKQPCTTETVTLDASNGQVTSARSIPCPSTTLVLPNVVGMVTPTAMGELSGLGVGPVIEDVHSATVPKGHIVSLSPSPGTRVHARQSVIVRSSI
jgi:hypothetical protein